MPFCPPDVLPLTIYRLHLQKVFKKSILVLSEFHDLLQKYSKITACLVHISLYPFYLNRKWVHETTSVLSSCTLLKYATWQGEITKTEKY